MARPEVRHPVHGPEDLEKLRKKLATMSVTAVADFYHAAYLRCALNDNKAPLARDIQELVQAWKEMRKW